MAPGGGFPCGEQRFVLAYFRALGSATTVGKVERLLRGLSSEDFTQQPRFPLSVLKEGQTGCQAGRLLAPRSWAIEHASLPCAGSGGSLAGFHQASFAGFGMAGRPMLPPIPQVSVQRLYQATVTLDPSEPGAAPTTCATRGCAIWRQASGNRRDQGRLLLSYQNCSCLCFWCARPDVVAGRQKVSFRYFPAGAPRRPLGLPD